MRNLTNTLMLLAFLPGAALAAPPIYASIPEWELEGVEPTAAMEKADARLSAAHAAVDARKDAVVQERARLKDARKESREQSGRVFAAHKAWHVARRSADPAAVDAHHADLVRQGDHWLAAREHVQWHRLSVKAARKDVATARAEVSLSVAKRERAEAAAVAAARPQEAFWFPPARYERQIDRVEQAVDSREALAASIRIEEDAARAAWVATTR